MQLLNYGFFGFKEKSMYQVDLTQFFPFTMITHIVRALFTYIILRTIVKEKKNTFLSGMLFLAITVFYSYISVTSAFSKLHISEFLLMVLYYVIVFVFSIFMTEGKLFNKLFASILPLIAWELSATVFVTILTALTDNTLQFATTLTMPLELYLTYNGFMFCSSFVFVFIIKLIGKKTNGFNYNFKYTLYFIYPITHLFCFMFIASLLQNIPDSVYRAMDKKGIPLDASLLTFTALCMIADIVLIFIIDKNQKREEKNIENEKSLLKAKLDYEQIMMYNSEKQEFRKLKHDYANIITTAKGFIEIGKPEKSAEILSKASYDISGISQYSPCSNDTINTVLYLKRKQALNSGVSLDIDVDETFALKIDDYDLCRLLGNIIDNSISAAAETNAKKSRVLIEIDKEHFAVITKNEIPNEEYGKKRRKSKEHGNGIGIISEIAKKYNGTYDATAENGIYTAKVVLTK